ncbi:MAG TPA: Mut7-C RNAse domain-containing protein [Polyangiaceae bacterium]|nr:Mut7-C RNAse domain-containing protein [Polyangiaceae bacterium]
MPEGPAQPEPALDELRFFCDAMLGGLARWLRAAGYDALFEHGIDDGDLVRRAAESGRVVLSSDGPLFDRVLVRRGEARALFVPRGLAPLAQLGFVLRTLGLPRREPHCMACGGRLREIDRAAARAEAPPKAFAHYDRFWRCERCEKLFWRGTHWARIGERLAALPAAEGPAGQGGR